MQLVLNAVSEMTHLFTVKDYPEASENMLHPKVWYLYLYSVH